MLLVPSVQHLFPGVVVHHGVVAVLVCELYVGVPLCSCLGIVSKVDGSGTAAVAVDTVDHSTGHKGIAHTAHLFYMKQTNQKYTANGNKTSGAVRSGHKETAPVVFPWHVPTSVINRKNFQFSPFLLTNLCLRRKVYFSYDFAKFRNCPLHFSISFQSLNSSSYVIFRYALLC